MTPYRTFFDPETGEIVECSRAGVARQVEDVTAELWMAGLDWIDGEGDPALHCIVGGQIVARPAIAFPDVVAAGVEIDGIPDGSVVSVDGLETEPGTTGLRFDVPGRWQVEIAPPFPWRPVAKTVVVE